MDKSEKAQVRGVNGFKSGVSVEIYLRIFKELAEAILESFMFCFLRRGREREKGLGKGRDECCLYHGKRRGC